MKHIYLVAIVGTLYFGCGQPSSEERGGDASEALLQRVQALEAQVQEMAPAVAELKRLQEYLKLNKNNDVVVQAANLYVQDGTGATYDGGNPGKGNLIVGYDEDLSEGGAAKTGSHNLIVGPGHHYTGIANLIAGTSNKAVDQFGVVFGGGNTVSGYSATVTGGSSNQATGVSSSVCGGTGNVASGNVATVAGTWNQTAADSGALLPPCKCEGGDRIDIQ